MDIYNLVIHSNDSTVTKIHQLRQFSAQASAYISHGKQEIYRICIMP